MDEKQFWLGMLEDQVNKCTKCVLCETRNKVVFSDGNPLSPIMIVGEAPGADEDACGKPFVGRAGKLLDKWLQESGIARENVFICNIIKCRPPGNRKPSAAEISSCIGFFESQVEIIKPKAILLLGSVALCTLFGKDLKITELRGTKLEYKGISAIPTFHPAYVLRQFSQEKNEAVLSDIKLAFSCTTEGNKNG